MTNSELYHSLLKNTANLLFLENVAEDFERTKEERKKAADLLKKSKAELKDEIKKFIADFFDGGKKKYDLLTKITEDFEALRAKAEKSWGPTLDKLKSLLLKQTLREARQRSLGYKLTKNWWVIVLIIITTGAVVRYFAAVEVTDPITTEIGVVQRSAAFKKLLRHESLMLEKGLRKGGPLKRLLYFPLEPTKAEVVFAEEFMGATKEVYDTLQSQSALCNVPENYADDPRALPQAVINFIDKGEYVRAEDSIKLIASALLNKFPCSKN